VAFQAFASALKNSSRSPCSPDQGLKDTFPAVFWPWFGGVGFLLDLPTWPGPELGIETLRGHEINGHQYNFQTVLGLNSQIFSRYTQQLQSLDTDYGMLFLAVREEVRACPT
jgi:hypothetical protein